MGRGNKVAETQSVIEETKSNGANGFNFNFSWTATDSNVSTPNKSKSKSSKKKNGKKQDGGFFSFGAPTAPSTSSESSHIQPIEPKNKSSGFVFDTSGGVFYGQTKVETVNVVRAKKAKRPKPKNHKNLCSSLLRKVLKCSDGTNWTKLCKAAKITIRQRTDGTYTVVINDKSTEKTIVSHDVPKGAVSHLSVDAEKFWGRWMMQNDEFQGDNPQIVMVYFQDKAEFNRFGQVFTK